MATPSPGPPSRGNGSPLIPPWKNHPCFSLLLFSGIPNLSLQYDTRPSCKHHPAKIGGPRSFHKQETNQESIISQIATLRFMDPGCPVDRGSRGDFTGGELQSE